MERPYRTVEEYNVIYKQPIILKSGDRVHVEKRETNPDWIGWVFCRDKNGIGGWVSETYLEFDGEDATVIRDYEATELSVKPGEIVFGVKDEFGWVWCKNARKEEGWVPLKSLVPVISLVPASPDYAEYWFKWRSESNAVKFNPMAKSTVEDLRARIAAASSDLRNLTADEFMFFGLWGQEPVGTVSLKGVSHTMGYGEIGYSVSQDVQGKKVGTTLVGIFISKVFSETSLRRLTAYVAADNTASCKLLERRGFQKEGLCRKHYLINGVPTDEAYYGLLREEWKF